MAGLTKERSKRTNHKSAEKLLVVPRYSDLLDDQNDEDEEERGRMLVNNRQSWRTEMAKWIGDARAAELEEVSSDDSDDDEPLVPATIRNDRGLKYRPLTLATLFGGQKERLSRSLPREIDAEAELMQALAELEEEENLDDGAIEIPSEDEYEDA